VAEDVTARPTAVSQQAKLFVMFLSSCPPVDSCQAPVTKKTCSFVQLEEDSSCSCGCLHEQMTSCSSRQEFSNSRCKCECLEDKEEKLCLDQGRMWDTDKCECSCPISRLQPCSTGRKIKRVEIICLNFQGLSLIMYPRAPVFPNILQIYQIVSVMRELLEVNQMTFWGVYKM